MLQEKTTENADLGRLLSIMTGDEKHTPAAHSTLDVLWVLYDRVLRLHPDRPADPARDRFYLSKGHGPMAYYAVLAAKGFIAEEELSSWASFGSPLGHHPDRVLLPGVEIGSGSLGHGLGMAVGASLALLAHGNVEPRVFCLIGDGELDEGSTHEAIHYAGRVGLDRLTAIVVDNRSSTHGWPGGIARRFVTEGWWTHLVDGTDHDAMAAALAEDRFGKPHAVVVTVAESS